MFAGTASLRAESGRMHAANFVVCGTRKAWRHTSLTATPA